MYLLQQAVTLGNRDAKKREKEKAKAIKRLQRQKDNVQREKQKDTPQKDGTSCDLSHSLQLSHRDRNASQSAPSPTQSLILPEHTHQASYHQDDLHSTKRDQSSEPSDLWTISTLRKYIAYVKSQYQPRMSAKAVLLLKKFYTLSRQNAERSASRTTVRLLESLMRLSEAHAKLMCRNVVHIQDSVVAIALVNMSEMQTNSSLLTKNIGATLQTPFPIHTEALNMYETLEEEVFGLLHITRESLDREVQREKYNNNNNGGDVGGVEDGNGRLYEDINGGDKADVHVRPPPVAMNSDLNRLSRKTHTNENHLNRNDGHIDNHDANIERSARIRDREDMVEIPVKRVREDDQGYVEEAWNCEEMFTSAAPGVPQGTNTGDNNYNKDRKDGEREQKMIVDDVLDFSDDW